MLEAEFEVVGDFTAGLHADERICAFSVGPNGEAIALALDRANAKAPFATWEQTGWATFPQTRAVNTYEAAVLIHNGSTVTRTDLRDIDTTFPRLQTLPGSEILIVGARSQHRSDGTYDLNARVFGLEGGRLRREFLLGDGINDVQTTRDGRIWVAYGDEGIFGNFGWSEPGGPRAVGARGLVRFDSTAQMEWEYRSPRGREVADCYALNVGNDEVWIYYYEGYWMAQISKEDHVRTWHTPINGAQAIAISNRAALLYGAGPELFLMTKFNRFGRLGRPAAVAVAEPAVPIDREYVIGRGPVIHALSGTSWLQLDVRRIKAS